MDYKRGYLGEKIVWPSSSLISRLNCSYLEEFAKPQQEPSTSTPYISMLYPDELSFE